MRPRSGTLERGGAVTEGEAETEAALVSTAAPLTALLVGAAAGGVAVVAVAVETGVDLVEVSTGAEVAELTGTAAGTAISKGGLYSKVPVRSSMILMPYLLPAGIFAESSNVPGTVHVYVPEFAVFASQC